MKEKYLEVTFRKGKVMAAYLYLPREPGEKIIRTEKLEQGILVDYGQFNRPIGIEITCPDRINLEMINNILDRLKSSPVQKEDFAPLFVA